MKITSRSFDVEETVTRCDGTKEYLKLVYSTEGQEPSVVLSMKGIGGKYTSFFHVAEVKKIRDAIDACLGIVTDGPRADEAEPLLVPGFSVGPSVSGASATVTFTDDCKTITAEDFAREKAEEEMKRRRAAFTGEDVESMNGGYVEIEVDDNVDGNCVSTMSGAIVEAWTDGEGGGWFFVFCRNVPDMCIHRNDVKWAKRFDY